MGATSCACLLALGVDNSLFLSSPALVICHVLFWGVEPSSCRELMERPGEERQGAGGEENGCHCLNDWQFISNQKIIHPGSPTVCPHPRVNLEMF